MAGKVQTNRMSIARARLNKYSKISNICVSFESNRIPSNYSIRFEISNIRTALADDARFGDVDGYFSETSQIRPLRPAILYHDMLPRVGL